MLQPLVLVDEHLRLVLKHLPLALKTFVLRQQLTVLLLQLLHLANQQRLLVLLLPQLIIRAECIEGERSDLFGSDNILIFENYMRVRDYQ